MSQPASNATSKHGAVPPRRSFPGAKATSFGWLTLRVLKSAVVLYEALEQRDELRGFRSV